MSEATIPIQAAPPRLSEDVVALVLGLAVFVLALVSLLGPDALGWLVNASVWADPSTALAPASKAYASLGGLGALFVTYLVLTAVLSLSAYLLGDHVGRFALAFTSVFALAYASWFVGNWAYLAAVTPADQAKFGVSWSLKLTNEGGYIVALVVGLVIANVFPAFAERLRTAVRPELYIKIAIVILGASIAVTVASKLTLASSLMLRGFAAIVEAYLIYWPVVYLIARKGFRLQPRMGGAAGLRRFNLRRLRGDRDRRRDPRPPSNSHSRVVAGRRVRCDRSLDPTDHRTNVHVP